MPTLQCQSRPTGKSIALLGFALCGALLPGTGSGAQFGGTATNFGREECITLDHFSKESGAQYLEKDSAQEAKLCGIDFDSKTIGLCPKIWSTSPGTMKAITYRQLIYLSKDFQVKGPLYNYLRNTFYLNDDYTELIAQNTIQATNILQSACKGGKLRFDLDPERLLTTGKVEEIPVDCLSP